MRKFIILTAFIFLNCKKDISKQNIYEVYNKCYSEKIRVDRKPISSFIKEFERELIKNNYLKDSTGRSYIDFVNEMETYDFIVLKSNYSFIDSTKNFSRNVEEIKKCPIIISSHPKFNETIFGKMKKYIDKNGTDKGFFTSMPVDSIVTEKDFNFDYLKQKLFGTIKIYKEKNIQNGRVFYKKENYPEKVVLYINSKQELLWNSKKIKLSDLKNKLSDYFLKYSKDKIVFYESDRKVKYGDYIKVQFEIENFKDEFYNSISKRLFNKKTSELTEDEKWEIKNEYNLKIIDL